MPTRADKPSDAELVRAAGQGDREAFSTLVDRHLSSVYAVAMRLLGNAADAEDVSQDTFLRAFERLGLYSMEYSFRNWLLKIASNLAINRIRSRGRERLLPIRLSTHQTSETSPSKTDKESPGARAWGHWLDQLNLSQRTAIVLFHFHEMTYTQIAEVLDVSVNSVRTHLHRGRKRLRELMTRRDLPEGDAWNVAIQNG